MILICYDGSENAKEAIAHAGRLFAGHDAVVLSVWEPLTVILSRTTAGMGPFAGTDIDEVDKSSRAGAHQTAAEGAALARDAGLHAQPRVLPRTSSIAEAILTEGDHLDADAIVVGTRGRGELGSLLLGSVSHAVVQHADCPVVVVPGRRAEPARLAPAAGQPSHHQ